MALPTYIPIEDAARRLGLTPAQLRLLAKSGKIAAAQLPDGDVMVDEKTLQDTGELPRYIPLAEAVERYQLDASRLMRLIDDGELSAITTPDGEVMVDEKDMENAALGKEALPEYKEHANLRGIGIGIAEAARKYNVPTSTIHGWYQRGLITQIGRDGQKILLDEADAAYCSAIYHKYGMRGRPLFNPDGTPKVHIYRKADTKPR